MVVPGADLVDDRGNGGQTDYSAANDLLCKSTSALRRTRPATRGIVVDWTAWAGIGMASRGSIPKMMELAGIDMLPPEVGVPTIRRELVAGGARGEVVVGGRLGMLGDEWDLAGGLDAEAVAARATGPILGRVVGMGIHGGLVVETTLDPAAQPFLDHHRIDGTAVLPGVMGIEGFAELASLPLPGWRVAAVQDVRFLAPVKFYRDEPRTLTLSAWFAPDGDELVAECRLTSLRQLVNQPEPQATTHFTGRVRLTRAAAEPDLLPRSRLPGPRAGLAGRRPHRGRAQRGPAARPLAGRHGPDSGAAPDRAVLPDRRGPGARRQRSHGPAGAGGQGAVPVARRGHIAARVERERFHPAVRDRPAC